jgi:hypothetical protein
MLRRILTEIKKSSGTVDLYELQQKLGINRSTLEGMIQHLVRTGRLVDDNAEQVSANQGCAGSSCGSCAGLANCAFVAKMPKTYSLQLDDQEIEDIRSE